MTLSTSTSNRAVTIDENFPSLPLLCLATAQETTTHALIQSDCWIVIDFWTTRCTRCPAALDALNERAMAHAAATKKEEEESIFDVNDMDMNDNILSGASPSALRPTRFYGICCGESSDTARQIMEQGDVGVAKWPSIEHYYMDSASKEIAKTILGFSQVPFYVILDIAGRMVQKGTGKQMDWSVLSQQQQQVAEKITPTLCMLESQAQAPLPDAIVTDGHVKTLQEVEPVANISPTSDQEAVFELDDMDF